MSGAEIILEALTSGGMVLARAEAARVVNAAPRRLSARGEAGKELALVADALARDDADLGDQMDRLTAQQRTTAAQQLNQAATYAGSDSTEQIATHALRDMIDQLAGQVGDTTVHGGVSICGDATVTGPIHAPAAGRDINYSGPPA